MRLGPKEKQILKKLVPGAFTPPSIYLGDYGSCPSGHTLNRIVDKGLAECRYQTQTPEENRKANAILKPGHEAAEYNAALRPTRKGEEIIRALMRFCCEYNCPKCGTIGRFVLGKFPPDLQAGLSKELLYGEGVIADCCNCHAILLLKIEGKISVSVCQ